MPTATDDRILQAIQNGGTGVPDDDKFLAAIRKGTPDTLPANFSGWDAPASPHRASAPPDTLPADFSGFDEPAPKPVTPTNKIPLKFPTTQAPFPAIDPALAAMEANPAPSEPFPEPVQRGLEAVNKYAVQPFEKMAATGAKIGAGA